MEGQVRSPRRSMLTPAAAEGWRVSLILPAYNEEGGIRQAIAEADDALTELKRAEGPAGRVLDYEILVVDDGSRDGTAEAVVEEAVLRPRVRLLRHDENRGYGAALRTGFEAARFERVAFTDADSQFYLADLARLLPLSEHCAVAVGYRQARKDPWQRRLLSRGYNLLVRTLLGTGVRDCDCALKVFHRDVLPALLPETDGFFVNAEMLARARQQGYDVAEVGVRHRQRSRGRSKVSLTEVPRALATLLPFWWTRILFPAPLTETEPRPRGRRAPSSLLLRVLPVVLLCVVAGLLFGTRLKAPLLEPQEPRYAEIPRQMLHEGRFLVPVLHGQPYLDKPPLLYWLVMGSYKLFGVHDWAARLVPALAGLATVLLTWLWGRRVLGARAGLLAALVLTLSADFVYRERMLSMDGLLCLWTVAGLMAGHLALLGPELRRGWWLLSALCCGLGLLTKGPVSLVLIAGPLLIYAFLEARCARVSRRQWLGYAGIALLVALPWYAAVAVSEPGFLGYFFWKHNVVRFVAAFDHDKPAWFYLPQLLLGLLPWTLLLPGLAIFLTRRSERAALRRPPALGFFLLAALMCLLFFSLAGSKRPLYLLPAMPSLALALGCYLDVLLVRSRRCCEWADLFRRTSQIAYGATMLTLGLGAVCAVLAVSNHLVRPGLGLPLAGGAVSVAVLLACCRHRLTWMTCCATTAVVLVAGVLLLSAPYNRRFALRGALQSSPDLNAIPNLRVVCYPQRWDSVSFYLPKANVVVYTAAQRAELLADLKKHPETLLVVKKGRVMNDVLRRLPASMAFEPRRGSSGLVVAGWVRPHREAPLWTLAQR